MNVDPLQNLTQMAFFGVLVLIVVGIYGLMARRNLIKLVVALQLLTKGAVLALVIAGAVSGQPRLGESLAISVIAVDTVIAAVALALAIQIKRRGGSLDIGTLTHLKG